jgi:hypothetical protein
VNEPTEMAGVAEAETEAAYAWALDYDDVDDVSTTAADVAAHYRAEYCGQPGRDRGGRCGGACRRPRCQSACRTDAFDSCRRDGRPASAPATAFDAPHRRRNHLGSATPAEKNFVAALNAAPGAPPGKTSPGS